MASHWPPPGHFALLYFAAASEFTRRSVENIPAPIHATGLFGVIEQRYPGITDKVLSSCAVTVNLQYVDLDGDDAADKDLIIQEGDEVAIIPPVSSG
ncbi:Molybdopterin synthase sulfur carrier subunit [Mytilinidion resinicola]|uniref:Molybdopterin synthase sulfur carrier subunit n=1 Tax=Mytilinidion resinicola TaxID=574789 RepID=A0A6A6Z4B0_9PEZI|nr:Molybdopterin synthase sulfur carrier subunit [Mytilinidion resinicola]KAF2815916.1 Molybdopterin synthase sulfur carrier subunit [Mytilinidion resinicola]